MLNLITTILGYIILIMCAIYTVSCFTVFLSKKPEKQQKRMARQERYMFFFHFLCYVMLYLKTKEINIILLYVAQLIFFILLLQIYKHFYKDCSRIMVNGMCFLLMIGSVMLTRINFDLAIKQFVIMACGTVIALFVPFFTEKAGWLKKLRWAYGAFGFLFLSSVFFMGSTVNGSTNWLKIGNAAIQPMEFVKIIFVFFIAAMLERANSYKGFLITAVFSALHVIVLILEKDLGGALLFFVVFVFMCFVATGRYIYLFGGFGIGALAGTLAYQLFDHVKTRFSAWRDPWSIIDGKGFQITQSLFAIGTGGIFGMGLTQGRPTDIPVAESDFIFSAICEELGLAFGICLILIYLSIFIQFLMIAIEVKDRFYKLVAYGFSICFIFQVFLNVGGVTKFIPSTGVTLPLISYGGSSVVSTLMIFGIMQGIFMITYKKEVMLNDAKEQEPGRTEYDESSGSHRSELPENGYEPELELFKEIRNLPEQKQ